MGEPTLNYSLQWLRGLDSLPTEAYSKFRIHLENYAFSGSL